jgi:hypothetical protein
MKKIFYILIFGLIFVGCGHKLSERDEVMLHPHKVSAQEFYDKVITHSVITDSAGHTLILHEVGYRGKYGYSFSIEHSPECKLCCEIYD